MPTPRFKYTISTVLPNGTKARFVKGERVRDAHLKFLKANHPDAIEGASEFTPGEVQHMAVSIRKKAGGWFDVLDADGNVLDTVQGEANARALLPTETEDIE